MLLFKRLGTEPVAYAPTSRKGLPSRVVTIDLVMKLLVHAYDVSSVVHGLGAEPCYVTVGLPHDVMPLSLVTRRSNCSFK